MRSTAWILGLVMTAGCADAVENLGPGAGPSGPADAGAAPPDGGFALDVGLPPADAGVVWPDAASPMNDAGMAPQCPSGWTTIAQTTAGQGIQTESFAALDAGYAVTWNVFDDDWVQSTFLQFFDAALTPRGPAQLVTMGSRVVAVDGRFLRGGPGGLQWYAPDGTPGETVNIAPFIPSVAIAGRVYGRVLRDASAPAPAVLINDFTQVHVYGVDLSHEAKVVFGEDRMVIVEGAETGVSVRLFLFFNDQPTQLGEHLPTAVEVDGVRWLPTQLSAGVWNGDLRRFELLFAMNMSNGRFFGPSVYSMTDTALVEGPLVLDPRVEVSHSSLEGAVAMSAGRVAVAYNDTYPQSDVELNVVIGGTTQIFPVGPNLRSQPMFAPTPDGLAILSAHHPGGAPYWETELQIRCDLF